MTVVMNRKQWHSIFKKKFQSPDSNSAQTVVAESAIIRYLHAEGARVTCHDEAGAIMIHGFGAGNVKDWTFNLSSSTNRRAKDRGKIPLFRIEGNKTVDCCA